MNHSKQRKHLFTVAVVLGTVFFAAQVVAMLAGF